MTDFIFLGSKITADDDCSHEINKHFLLGRKAMRNLDSGLKSRDISLMTKVPIVKVMIFPVVMYRCESCTIRKAECRKINTFELWCWRELLRFTLTARKSSQSILKEINPEYSLEWPMLKLKLQSFGHLGQRYSSLEKTPMLGKIEGMRRKGQQRMRWLDAIIDSMDISFKKLGNREGQGSLGHCIHVVTKSWTWLSNWTIITVNRHLGCLFATSWYFI